MEYLEGETLWERLKKGPLPLKEALRIGIEVSEALEAAHRAGIVHRDLKPGNIMLTKSGAKLMDLAWPRPRARVRGRRRRTRLFCRGEDDERGDKPSEEHWFERSYIVWFSWLAWWSV